MNQLNLFNHNQYPQIRPEKMVMDRDTLRQWKSKIRDYQQQAKNQQQPEQKTLFDLPRNTWETADEINPFDLKIFPADFYNHPESPEPLDDTNQGCIYFILDRYIPIILYIGITEITARKRCSGTHDCKTYLMRYLELHRTYNLTVHHAAAFWHHVPPQKKILREWETELISKWKPPFNYQCWHLWGQPFGK